MLESRKARISELRHARREPLDDRGVRDLLSRVDVVTIAKGRAARTLPAAEVVLDDLRGPTGNFRAPMLRVGRRLLVGFHPDSLDEILKGAP